MVFIRLFLERLSCISWLYLLMVGGMVLLKEFFLRMSFVKVDRFFNCLGRVVLKLFEFVWNLFMIGCFIFVVIGFENLVKNLKFLIFVMLFFKWFLYKKGILSFLYCYRVGGRGLVSLFICIGKFVKFVMFLNIFGLNVFIERVVVEVDYF